MRRARHPRVGIFLRYMNALLNDRVLPLRGHGVPLLRVLTDRGIPAARIKGHREHRVPLSDRVLEILASCRARTATRTSSSAVPPAPA